MSCSTGRSAFARPWRWTLFRGSRTWLCSRPCRRCRCSPSRGSAAGSPLRSTHRRAEPVPIASVSVSVSSPCPPVVRVFAHLDPVAHLRKAAGHPRPVFALYSLVGQVGREECPARLPVSAQHQLAHHVRLRAVVASHGLRAEVVEQPVAFLVAVQASHASLLLVAEPHRYLVAVPPSEQDGVLVGEDWVGSCRGGGEVERPEEGGLARPHRPFEDDSRLQRPAEASVPGEVQRELMHEVAEPFRELFRLQAVGQHFEVAQGHRLQLLGGVGAGTFLVQCLHLPPVLALRR